MWNSTSDVQARGSPGPVAEFGRFPPIWWQDHGIVRISPERRRDRRNFGPDASPAVLLAVAGYFCAHSQKFHQTPVWFGMYFTPVMRSLYASTPTDWNSGRP